MPHSLGRGLPLAGSRHGSWPRGVDLYLIRIKVRSRKCLSFSAFGEQASRLVGAVVAEREVARERVGRPPRGLAEAAAAGRRHGDDVAGVDRDVLALGE